MNSKSFEIKRMSFPRSREAFKAEVIDAGVPVVFTDFCEGWEALQTWTPEYLSKETENSEGLVYITDRKELAKGLREEKHMTIKDLMALFKTPEYKQGTIQYYLAGNNLQNSFTNLARDIQPFPFGSTSDSVLDNDTLIALGLWVGSDGQTTSAHFDCAQNLNTVIRGKKVFTLSNPETYLDMYGHTWKSCEGNDRDGQIYRFSQADIVNQDLTKFPRLAKVNFTSVTIGKGETLYIPVGWWHHVQSFGEEEDGVHAALNLFWDASEEYWARKELRYINDFRTKYAS